MPMSLSNFGENQASHPTSILRHRECEDAQMEVKFIERLKEDDKLVSELLLTFEIVAG